MHRTMPRPQVEDHRGGRDEARLMKDLVPVHGGLSEPLNRHVTLDRIREFEKEASAAPMVIVDDADLSSVYPFGPGALSPLSGAMKPESWHRTLDTRVCLENGQAPAHP